MPKVVRADFYYHSSTLLLGTELTSGNLDRE